MLLQLLFSKILISLQPLEEMYCALLVDLAPKANELVGDLVREKLKKLRAHELGKMALFAFIKDVKEKLVASKVIQANDAKLENIRQHAVKEWIDK